MTNDLMDASRTITGRHTKVLVHASFEVSGVGLHVGERRPEGDGPMMPVLLTAAEARKVARALSNAAAAIDAPEH